MIHHESSSGLCKKIEEEEEEREKAESLKQSKNRAPTTFFLKAIIPKKAKKPTKAQKWNPISGKSKVIIFLEWLGETLPFFFCNFFLSRERKYLSQTLSLSSFVCTCNSHVGFDAVMDGEYLWLQRIEWAKVKKLSSLFWIILNYYSFTCFLGQKIPCF